MKQAEQIEHQGIVALVERDFVRVVVTVNEACGGCAARTSCAMGSSEKREIDIYTHDASLYRVGEQVDISAHRTIGVMAVVLCYVVPLIVLVVAVVVANGVGFTEGFSAIIALAFTTLYFGVLSLFHKNISKKVTFKIHKK